MNSGSNLFQYLNTNKSPRSARGQQHDTVPVTQAALPRCTVTLHSFAGEGSVRETFFYVFFQIPKKRDFLRFFELAFQKKRKKR